MTHTFEIRIGSTLVEGEMNFNGGNNTKITINQPVQIQGPLFNKIKTLLNFCGEVTVDYGELEKVLQTEHEIDIII